LIYVKVSSNPEVKIVHTYGYKLPVEFFALQSSSTSDVNPAKRNAMAVKNEMRFSLQKRNVLQKSRLQSFRLSYPVEIQVSFKRLLKTI